MGVEVSTVDATGVEGVAVSEGMVAVSVAVDV